MKVNSRRKRVPASIKQEGLKAGLKAVGKKAAKAVFNEVIEELPGPPGHLARIIKSEVAKANRAEKQKQLAKDISKGVMNSIKGSGDYIVNANSILRSSTVSTGRDSVPTFHNVERGVRVTHREYLGDVVSSSTASAFQNTVYNVNPGIAETFPWLSVIAQNFDQWQPNGIVVSFKSTSSEFNGASQALGTVIIASDYDLLDSAYTSKVEMENSQFAVSCKSSENIMHPIECAPGERPIKTLKCRSATTPSDNLQWYDLCTVQVATQGIAGTSVTLGELWITYDITFYKEQLYGSLKGQTILFYQSTSSSSISTSDYFGTETANTDSNLDLTLTGTTITFPASVGVGDYLLSYFVIGNSTAVTKPTITATSNCTSLSGSFGSYNAWGTAAGTTTTDLVAMATFRITGPSAVITFSGGTLPASATACVFSVTQINSAY